jgi:hypothetical protein
MNLEPRKVKPADLYQVGQLHNGYVSEAAQQRNLPPAPVDFYTREPIPQQGSLFERWPGGDGPRWNEADLEQLLRRTNLGLKWIETELAIARNVFKPGHAERKKKLGERLALKLLLQDYAQMLDWLLDQGENRQED